MVAIGFVYLPFFLDTWLLVLNLILVISQHRNFSSLSFYWFSYGYVEDLPICTISRTVVICPMYTNKYEQKVQNQNVILNLLLILAKCSVSEFF